VPSASIGWTGLSAGSGVAGSKCDMKFQLSVRVGLLHNGEHLHISQQINVNVSVFIDIKTTLLTFSTFLWTS
jgi:hypothetical protein